MININIDPAAPGAPVLHEVALHADADLALADLQVALAGAGDFAVEPDWLPRLRHLRAEYERKLEEMALAPSPAMHPAALARAIAAALPRDALVVYDGGHTTFWSNDLTPTYGVHALSRSRHEPTGIRASLCAGAAAAAPGRPVVNITGDGAFGFTLQSSTLRGVTACLR